MPIRKVKGGWKYGSSATFKKKPTQKQIAAIEMNKEEKRKKVNRKRGSK